MNINNITKRYSNGDITVVWQSGKCIHSANCVKNLPQVFNTKASPWINVENAPTEEIIATVNKCPSGALSIIRNNEK